MIAVSENQTITILVLENDSDPNGGYISLLDVTAASTGDVTLDPTLNTLVYTPWPDFIGEDSFEYTITNDLGLIDTATVTVTVEEEAAEVILLYVLEGAEVGTFVGQVSVALDGSTASEFQANSGSDASPFLLQQNGEVYVEGVIDALPGDLYTFAVTASDGTNSEDVLVAVEVLAASDPTPNGNTEDVNDYIIVPELSPVGTIVGNIEGHGSDISADQYTIVSGDQSGAFSIDSFGDIQLDLPLNFEIHPGYLLGIQMQNSATGETATITLAVFIENDPLNDLFPDTEPFVGPIQYTDDTVIGWISIGLDARFPSQMRPARLDKLYRWGDINAHLRGAISTGKLLTTHGDGEWWWLDTSSGAVLSIRGGPKLMDLGGLQNQKRANQWIGKLIEEEEKHKGYIYYNEFQLANFFSKLREVAKTLTYTSGELEGTTKALYHSTTTEIEYKGEIADLSPETVIHETVHALDHSNRWYLPTTGSTYNAEGLGYGAGHMMKSDALFLYLRAIEKELKKPSPNVSVLQANWFTSANYLKNLTNVVVNYLSTYGYQQSASLTDEQLQDVQAKILPAYTMKMIALIYKQIANEKGADYDFPTTGIIRIPDSNDPPIDIPAYFR